MAKRANSRAMKDEPREKGGRGVWEENETIVAKGRSGGGSPTRGAKKMANEDCTSSTVNRILHNTEYLMRYKRNKAQIGTGKRETTVEEETKVKSRALGKSRSRFAGPAPGPMNFQEWFPSSFESRRDDEST